MSARSFERSTGETKGNPEEWEIEAIGCFLLRLYHQNKLLTKRRNWCLFKNILNNEFDKFLNLPENVEKNVRGKFKKIHGKVDIGSLLEHTKYLFCARQNNYRIKYDALAQYEKQKLDEFDEKCKNHVNFSSAIVPNGGDINTNDGSLVDPALECFEVDEDSESCPLEYQGTHIDVRVKNFELTSIGCAICQCNFETPDLFELHVQYHGDESDFKWLRLQEKNEVKNSCLKLSYQFCKNSHYFCFTLRTDSLDIIIEKIIIVKSRSMFYVKNTSVPYPLGQGVDKFFVDSHHFAMHQEQAIVIVFHKQNDTNRRIVEQHHFMRVDEFPVVHFSINPNRLPSKSTFKPKCRLQFYIPSSKLLLKKNIDLLNISDEFTDYINNERTLTSYNMRQALNTLLQIEDIDTLHEYISLTQYKAKLRKISDEYSLQVETKKHILIENILAPYDEVVVIPENTDNEPIKESRIYDFIMNQKFNCKNKLKFYKGEIQRISNGRVVFVCYKKIPIDLQQSFTVLFCPSRLTIRHQYRALEMINRLSAVDIQRFLYPECVGHIDLPNTNLILYNNHIKDNPEQLQAVINIAEGPRREAPYIIFGPPGTGKTTTVVEAVLQLYLRRPDTKILISAGSNSACDEIALRLCKILSPLNETRSIARIYSRCNEKRIDNIDEVLLESSNMYSVHFYPDVNILHSYRIVVCTLNVVGKLGLGNFGKDEFGRGIFTHVFIDEVAASTEVEVLVCMSYTLSSKASLIISGDHKQLGPILHSQRAEDYGLNKSLMERLLNRECYRVGNLNDYDRSIQTRLCRNYRSHPKIVNLFSSMFYDNELISCATDDVKDMCEKWHKSPNPNFPIIFHSVFGNSVSGYNTVSLYNTKEIDVVLNYVKDLMCFGINGHTITEKDIGIISPYKKQYSRIQEELNLRKWQIETGSVETFQGKEKAIIIVSFVRSFTSSLGFLDNPRRLNVTISRAKSLLILIGNPKTLSLNADFKRIINECEKNKTMVGARIYYDDGKEKMKENENLNNKQQSASNVISNNVKPPPQVKKQVVQQQQMIESGTSLKKKPDGDLQTGVSSYFHKIDSTFDLNELPPITNRLNLDETHFNIRENTVERYEREINEKRIKLKLTPSPTVAVAANNERPTLQYLPTKPSPILSNIRHTANATTTTTPHHPLQTPNLTTFQPFTSKSTTTRPPTNSTIHLPSSGSSSVSQRMSTYATISAHNQRSQFYVDDRIYRLPIEPSPIVYRDIRSSNQRYNANQSSSSSSKSKSNCNIL